MTNSELVPALARRVWRYGLAGLLRERIRRLLTDPEVKGTLSP